MSASNSPLNELIERWCQTQLSGGCSGVSAERMDELKDHLWCVAEARMEQGATPEEAMEFAIEQFGDTSEVRRQLTNSLPLFRRWLGRVHCKSTPAREAAGSKVVLMSLVIAAAMLVSAWLAQDDRTYAFISTVLIAVWVVLASNMGGTRQAARAEWRWLMQKLGR